MCLAIPARIVEIVDVRRNVNVGMLDIEVLATDN